MQEGKKRHGCLTAYLILMLIANFLVVLIYSFFLLASNAMQQSMPDIPGWVVSILCLFAIFNILCAIALFKWKRWGFWGFCASAVIIFIINLSIGVGIFQSVMGLLGVAILFGVLQIGKENKGWPQLD